MKLEPQCPVVVVAGTNGKGSVCAYLTQIYKQAGFKVGTLTSPHLLRYNERIAVNAEPVSDDLITETVSSPMWPDAPAIRQELMFLPVPT